MVKLEQGSSAIMNWKSTIYALIFSTTLATANFNYGYNQPPRIPVNKCCEQYEVMLDKHCVHMNETNESIWHPIFTSENGRTNVPVDFVVLTGSPDCGSTQQWPIYYYKNSTDVLRLLPSGVLRHYLYHEQPEEEETGYSTINGREIMYHDYPSGKYCMEKNIEDNRVSEYALVCAPEQHTDWSSTAFLMRNILNPITHGLSMACFLTVAVIYFVMPTLRDLVGNIVTTICMCFIFNQAADLIRLLTVFTNHVSIIVAETICYIALLGAFFWLNSLGYYIWKTFKSRNVYLRITDGKKYCYYSGYAWSCTVIMGALALGAHYTMDYPQLKNKKFEEEQETIGSLGIIIFFVPIAFTVIINIVFFATTLKILNRMNTYGRIHHKLKHSFRMFLLLFLIMTITWLFFLLSFTKYEVLVYIYIILNGLQAPLFLYVCIFNQKHVSFLIRKACCYTNCACECCRPEPECEWGDEMTAMNTGVY